MNQPSGIIVVKVVHQTSSKGQSCHLQFVWYF